MTARYSDIDLNGFQGWLAEQGADILEPTNEYEKLRYRFGKSGIALVYWKPSKRIYSMVGPAAAHYRRWQAGESIGEPFIKTPTPTPSARPQIKVYTDASIYSQTQTGSWGAVLMMPDKSEHEFSGPLIGNVDSSTAAEMMAVTNAVHRGVPARTERAVAQAHRARVGTDGHLRQRRGHRISQGPGEKAQIQKPAGHEGAGPSGRPDQALRSARHRALGQRSSAAYQQMPPCPVQSPMR